MVLGFLMLPLTTQYLGNQGRGEIAIFMANMAFVILINGFVGSSVLVYLTPKSNLYNLLIPAYSWAIVSSFVTPVVLGWGLPIVLNGLIVYIQTKFGHDIELVQLKNTGYYTLLVTCSILGSLFEYNTMILLGKQKIKAANLLNFLRITILTGLLVYLFKVAEIADPYGYFVALAVAYLIALVVSIGLILQIKERFDFGDFKRTFKTLVKLGFIDQVSNVLQFFNKRLPFYSLYFMFGKAEAGVFSVAVLLTEVFLFVPQSLSTVQYSKISNSQHRASYNIVLSEKMYRFSLVALIGLLGILCLVPDQVFKWVFGTGFDRVGELLPLLSVGIVSFGSTSIFNHYFSGIGKFEENVFSNSLALLVTVLVGCLYLVPKYGIWGAAITPSIAYGVLGLYLITSFKLKTNAKIGSFVPTKDDFLEFKELLTSRLKKRFGQQG